MKNNENITKIKAVLAGVLESVDLSEESPKDVIEFLKKELNTEGEFDSTGWDWDFWQTFLFNDNLFVVSGNGWLRTLIFRKE